MATKLISKKAQADGAQTITFDQTLGEQLKYHQHQIQVTVFNASDVATAPTAGSLTITVKSPGAEEFESIDSGVIDLTSRDNWLQTLDGNALALQFTPTGLDADKTYSVAINSIDA